MKDWKEIKKEIQITKVGKEETIGILDREIYRTIQLMCKKCNFYSVENGCSKKRIILDCRRKGLKNKE